MLKVYHTAEGVRTVTLWFSNALQLFDDGSAPGARAVGGKAIKN